MKPRTRVEREIGRLKIELFMAYHDNYMLITKQRMKLFENNGTIELTRDDGSTHHSDGRRWLVAHLRYFEQRDEPVFYTICASIKKVLDEYDAKFKTGEVLNQEDFSSFEIDLI